MSNEYKEWLLDRQEEAYQDIINIVDIISELYNKDINEEVAITNICKILNEGGWI